MSLNHELFAGDRFLVVEEQINADGVHVWPFNPLFPVDVLQHCLSGNRPFRMNRHDYFELVYLVSGELVWQVQDSFITEAEGDLFLMTIPKFHRVTEQSSTKVEVLSLFFDRRLLASATGSDSEYLDYLFAQALDQQHLISADTHLPREIEQLMREIVKESPALGDRARLCIRTYVKMILVLLIDQIIKVAPRHSSANRQQGSLDRLKPLFDAMEHGYSGRISTDDAADIVNMSLSTFRRTFAQLTGQSFVQYLNSFRIAKAQKLLASSDMPISEVCLEVGFCDQSYFGMIFRRLTQMTPRSYRQNLHRTHGIQAARVSDDSASVHKRTADNPVYNQKQIVSSGFNSIQL